MDYKKMTALPVDTYELSRFTRKPRARAEGQTDQTGVWHASIIHRYNAPP